MLSYGFVDYFCCELSSLSRLGPVAQHGAVDGQMELRLTTPCKLVSSLDLGAILYHAARRDGKATLTLGKLDCDPGCDWAGATATMGGPGAATDRVLQLQNSEAVPALLNIQLADPRPRGTSGRGTRSQTGTSKRLKRLPAPPELGAILDISNEDPEDLDPGQEDGEGEEEGPQEGSGLPL